MQVNEQLIDKLSHLARLRFNADEKEKLRNDLEKMIQFVEKLNELDLNEVEPLMHMSSEINVLREDELRGSVSTEAALRNAPDQDGTYFRVPKVIRKLAVISCPWTPLLRFQIFGKATTTAVMRWRNYAIHAMLFGI